jgi:thiol-disulfide isomerase/thioredoxin
MKVVLHLLLFTTLISCSSKDTCNTISVKLFDTSSNVIQIRYNDYLYQNRKSILLEDLDSIIELRFTKQHDFELYVNDTIYPVLVSDCNLIINIDDFNSGNNENNDVNQILKNIDSKVRNISLENGLLLNGYRDTIIHAYNQIAEETKNLNLFMNLTKQNRYWILNHIKYSSYEKIVKNGLRYCRNKKAKVESLFENGYLTFLKDEDLYNQANFYNSSFESFIDSYWILLNMIQFEEYYQKGFSERNEVLLNTIIVFEKYEKDVIRDILIGKSIVAYIEENNREDNLGLLKELLEKIEDDDVYSRVDEILSQLDVEEIVNSEPIFTHVLNGNAENYIIDVWTEYCKPCLYDLKHYYPKLIQEYQNEDIDFIFICLDTKESMFDKIGEDLKGKRVYHYYLSEIESIKLKNEMNIGAFPFSVLINKNREVVLKNISDNQQNLDNHFSM